MASLLLIARLVLSGVFAVSGAAKLVDRRGTCEALRGFGVGERLTAPAALALPSLELAAAGLLLPAGSARWGALLALGLLVAFTAGIALALARGESPDCHCFGRLHSRPAGRGAIARNLALGALAAFVLAAGWGDAGPSAVQWLGELSDAGVVAVASGTLIALLAAGGAALFVALLRRHGVLLRRLDALEHELGGSLPDLDGGRARVTALRDALVVFWNPECGFCEGLLPDLQGWDADPTDGAPALVVVSSGTRAESRALGLHARVLIDPGFTAGPAFGATGTPSAVMLDERGRPSTGVAVGAEEVRALMRQQRASRVRA